MNLRNFLRLAAIIGPLPNIIHDGDLVDAVPVMNDFNWIVNQVNANVPPLIPSAANQVVYVPQAAVGGTGNAITLAPSTPILAYAEGQSFRFRAANTNSGPVTINTSGLGVRTVTTPAGSALTGGEITAGGEYDVCDTGTVYMLMSVQSTGALSTWTPGLTFGGASVGMTFASQNGIWQKLNNMVYIAFMFQLSAKGSSAGSALVTGLPQNINAGYPNTPNQFIPIPGQAWNLATALASGSTFLMSLNPGAATLNLRYIALSPGSVIALGNLDFNNNTVIAGNGWYST